MGRPCQAGHTPLGLFTKCDDPFRNHEPWEVCIPVSEHHTPCGSGTVLSASRKPLSPHGGHTALTALLTAESAGSREAQQCTPGTGGKAGSEPRRSSQNFGISPVCATRSLMWAGIRCWESSTRPTAGGQQPTQHAFHPERVVAHYFWKSTRRWTQLPRSLVVQWLRICFAMQGTWVRSLARELRSHVLRSN